MESAWWLRNHLCYARAEVKLLNHGGDRKSDEFKEEENQGDIITLKNQRGTQASYIKARATAQAKAADPGVKPLADGRGNPTGNNQHRKEESLSNKHSSSGTSADYLVRRLKRDAPKVAEDLAQGKYPSARAPPHQCRQAASCGTGAGDE